MQTRFNKTLAYADSNTAVALAAKAGHTSIVTDSPPLSAMPNLPIACTNIEALISQSDANMLSAAAVEMAVRVDDKFQSSSLPGELGLYRDHVQLAGGVGRLACSLIHRATAMARHLTDTDAQEIDLFVNDESWHNPKSPLVSGRYASPFPSLDKAGFFAQRQVRLHSYELTIDRDWTSAERVTDLRRFLNLPLSTLAFEALYRAKITNWMRRRRGTAIVGHENEALKEALFWLAADGVRIIRIGHQLRHTGIDSSEAPSWLKSTVTELCGPPIEEALASTHTFDADQTAALQSLLLGHIAAGLSLLACRVGFWQQTVQNLYRTIEGPKIFLSGGLFAGDGAQQFGALKEAGVHVVDFEHGVTTGLSEQSQRKISFSEASTSNTLLVCSEVAQDAFSHAKRPEHASTKCIGLATQTRQTARPRLQRWFARRRLGLSKHECVLMHVSTWLYSANRRAGYAQPSDTFVLDMDRKLIQESYANIGKPVIFKRYPTKRFPEEPAPWDLYEVAPNICFAPDEDLRYLRAAADILVTGTPTSTLGWVVGSDVPIIWLASKLVNPLVEPTLPKEFEDSFITVDLDQPDWPSVLRRIASKSMDEISDIWQSKSRARADLYQKAILGPANRYGRTAAEIIAQLYDPGTQQIAEPATHTPHNFNDRNVTTAPTD